MSTTKEKLKNMSTTKEKLKKEWGDLDLRYPIPPYLPLPYLHTFC
jgi:hypothetical protein